MRRLAASVIFAILLATVVMWIPAYFMRYSAGQVQRIGSESYETVKSPQPVAAIESSEPSPTTPTTTVTPTKGITYTNVLVMLFVSITISIFVTILFVKIRG
jgi:hypothetical protein